MLNNLTRIKFSTATPWHIPSGKSATDLIISQIYDPISKTVHKAKERVAP